MIHAVLHLDLADARSQLYALEMKLLGKDVDKVTKPDEDQPLVIVGVDPGIVVAATATIAKASQLLETIKPYWKYSTSDPSASSSSSLIPTTTIGTQQITTNYIRPPKALKYTAKQKSAANFSSKHEKRRERYKQKHKNNEDDEQKRQKEDRTREIRHNIYHQKQGSSWQIKNSMGSVVFFGSYRVANSRIKEHKRGANSKLIKQLDAPAHDHVYITNEYKSSRTCPVCHSPTKHQKFRRNNKLKSVNGTLRCTNPQCRAHNSSTFDRDEVGGFNIAVSGLSKSYLLQIHRFPPFPVVNPHIRLLPTWRNC
ncbi:hypothetical protein BDC45DRAFT_341430 [Circinella umbellata]|nr:hypothetical protein BDC45DRAFT_341430 [Circinella umbellata]